MRLETKGVHPTWEDEVSNQPENIKKGLFVCLLIKMLHLCLFLLLQSSHSLQNDEWIKVPGGRSLLRECVHSIPSGSHLRFNTVTLSKCSCKVVIERKV